MTGSRLFILAVSVLISGCLGKHNIPPGPTMDLVAIKYDAAWLLGKEDFQIHGGAEKGFREVLELAPEFAEAHYNLAVALAHQSKWNEALSEFKRALRILPDFKLAKEGVVLAEYVVSHGSLPDNTQIPRYCRQFYLLYEQGC